MTFRFMKPKARKPRPETAGVCVLWIPGSPQLGSRLMLEHTALGCMRTWEVLKPILAESAQNSVQLLIKSLTT